MPKAENIRWTRLFAEGMAIIASILLAFWIDAWWEDRQQKRDETILLEAILSDLTEKKSELTRYKNFNQAIVESASTLINAAATETPPLGRSDIDRHIGFTWWYHNPTFWESAPMNALITGNGLADVSSPRLLQQLSELQLSIDRIKNLYANDQRFHNDVLVPFFIGNVDLPQIANATKHAPGDPENEYVFPEFILSAAFDHTALLSQREFRSLLVAKIDKLVDISRIYPDLEAQMAETMNLIRSELAK